MINQLIFVHIPRTAGTAFGTSVADWFRSQNKSVCPYSNWPDFLENKNNLSNFDLIGGHNYYPLIKFLDRPHEFITMLGDPINRSLSHRKFREMYNNHPILGGKYLAECIYNSDWELISNNLQTRMLGCDFGDDIKTDLDFELKVQPTKETLKFVKERLKSFTFFGIKEYFMASIDLFNKTYKSNCISIPNTNINSKSTYSSNIIKRLIEINEFDIELYRYGLKLFRERL